MCLYGHCVCVWSLCVRVPEVSQEVKENYDANGLVEQIDEGSGKMH